MSDSPQLVEQLPPQTSGLNETQTATGSLEKRKVNAGKLLRIIAATLLLFCACEAVARVLVVAFKPQEGPSPFFDHKLHLAQQPPKNNRPSLLFIGTSIGACSIYADLIDQKLRKNGYDLDVRNLCTVHSRMTERLTILKRAIESGAKPLLVVCDFDPVDCSAYFQEHIGRHQELEAMKKSDRESSLASKVIAVFADCCYLVKFHSFLHAFLLNAPSMILRPENHFAGYPFMADPDIAYTSKMGWGPAFDVLDQDSMNRMCLERGRNWFAVTQCASKDWFSLDEVRPLIEFCGIKRIPLAFLYHPIYPPSADENLLIESHHGVRFDEVAKYMGAAVAKTPDVYFMDFHAADGDCRHYADTGHQNPSGAVPHSEALAQTLLTSPFVQLLSKGQLGTNSGGR